MNALQYRDPGDETNYAEARMAELLTLPPGKFVDDTGDADEPISGLRVVDDDEEAPGFTFANLTEFVYQMNLEKGWIGDDRTIGDDLALIHSEVSEMLEEHRAGHEPNEVYYDVREDNGLKPLGIAVEWADAVIRLVDFAKRRGIDQQTALEIKLAYNATRPHRHGGKRL